MPISFAVAALGGDVVVDTVDGKVIYEVKPGTQTDTKVRLKGKGSCHTKDKSGKPRRGCYYRRIKFSDGKIEGLEFLEGAQ